MNTDWIKKGQTTANAVITAKGPPDIKTLTPDGDLVLAWIYAKQQRGNRLSVGAERVSSLVNDRGIVMDFQTRAGSVPTGM